MRSRQRPQSKKDHKGTFASHDFIACLSCYKVTAWLTFPVQYGIINSNGGNLQISSSTFQGNVANAGGCIYATIGSLNISGSTFINNNAMTSGGQSLKIFRVVVTGTGAIYMPGSMNISNCIFSGNSAANGAAIYSSNLNVSSHLFWANFSVYSALRRVSSHLPWAGDETNGHFMAVSDISGA